MDLGLSKRGEYVVRSAIALARAHPSGQPRKLRQVSDETGVPRTFVSQILGDLVHAGLAVSSFGVRGGYRLSRPPEEMNLLDVVEAGEGPLEVADCSLEGSCPWRSDCPLLGTFSAATVRVRATFMATTLADLVRGDWPVRRAPLSPERSTEDAGDAATGPGRSERRLPEPCGWRVAVAGAAAAAGAAGRGGRRPSEDLVEDPVELVGEGVSSAPDDRRPEGHDGEDAGVDDDGGQRGRRRDSQRDRELATAHGPSLRRSTRPTEPGGPGPAGGGSHGASGGKPSDVRGSPVGVDRAVTNGRAPDGTLPHPPNGPHAGRAPLTVVIVDDHALVREGTVQLLEAEPDIEVAGVAGTGEDGLGLVERLRPDVALVDVNLPGMSGLELARQARDRGLATRVLIVSAYDDYGYVTEALQLGVGGYLLKTASAQELVDSLRLVVDGVMVLDRAVSARLRHRWRGVPAQLESGGSLTPRELDVLRLLAEGRSNKEIAAALFLGLRTVESHVSSLLSKLGATSRTQVVALALRDHLVPSGGHPPSSHGDPAERG